MSSIIGLGLRGFLVLCGAVVLGLSVTLAKKQLLGSPPSETSFSAFSGAFGIIASALGIAAIFFDSIPLLVAAAVDALAAIFYLAAGVAMAVALKGVSCTDGSDKGDFLRYSNKLINGGCVDLKGPVCGVGSESDWKGALKSRCTQVQADFAFEFIACAFGLGALAFLFLSSKRSGRTSYV